jgi:hypothetical protein
MFFFALSQGYALDIPLQWDANTESDLKGYKVYYKTGSSGPPYNGTGVTEGNSPIDVGNVTQTSLSGLTDDVTYFIAITAYDNETPSLESGYSDEIDTKAPQITSPPTITSITDTTATIEWNTDEAGTSVVNYKKSEDLLFIEKKLYTYTTNHSVVLTGLESNSSYVFFVSSTDAGGAGPAISDTDNNHTEATLTPSDIYTFQTGASSDTTPPQITSPPTVTFIANTTAVIEWQTDEPSTSLVQYDDNSSTWGNYLWSKTDTSLVTTHSVTLTGLTADTTYYFRVGSTDGSGNGPTTSNEVNFTTESTPDTTDPIITTPPTVTGITQTTAIIEWQTDEPSNSLVDYGLTTSYGSQATLTGYVTNHSVTLTGLTVGTDYNFRVGSTDAIGNGPTYSNNSTFTTETVDDQPPQITSSPTVTNITDSTAVITWQTDEPSNSMVRYDTTSRSAWADYLLSENDAGMVTSHSVTLAGLNANQTYYFMVGSADAFGNGPDTSTTDNNPAAQQYFTTELIPDTAAPVISNVTAAGTTNTTAIITWTTDEPSNSMVQYGTSSSTWGNYLSSENDAGMVTTHTVTLTGLTVGSTYYFRVGSNDASGNGPDLNSNSTNPSAQQSFITDLTPDTDAPVISSVTVAGTTDTTAIITWTTDEPSNSMVHYGATTQNWGSYDSVESDAEMVTSHSVTLTGLTQGNTYHFRVGSTDALGNGPTLNPDPTNPSGDGNFTTTEPDTSAPVISNMTVAGTTDTIAIITWTTDELSNTIVRYDTVSRITWAGYQWSKNDAQMVTSHSVTLTGLTKGTTYYFRVGSNDVFGNGPDLNAGPSNPYPKPPVNDSSFTTTNTDTDPPSITGYSIDYVNDTIDITYDEANMQNANIEANYSFSPSLSFRTTGGSDDITYIGSNTYRLFMSIVPENTAFTLTVSGITDEAGNEVDPNSITIDIPPAAGGVKEVLPHHNAGIDDSIRIPNNTSFAARIEDSDGIDTTDLESIKFIIDDGVNLPYEYNLGNTTVVRVVQLDSTESADNVTKLWAVYDRSMDYTYGNVYSFGATVTISVDAKDKNQEWMDQGVYSFKVETQQQHDDAEASLPTTGVVDPSDPDLEGSYVYDTGAQISGGQLNGAKILYDSNEPITPIFGPTGEIPALNISGVDAVGVPMNLQPPTVFNTPVKIFIPCPGYHYASTLSVYRYTGTSWVLACNASGTVQAGGEGWMVPGSRVNHNLGNPSTIEIQVFHFTGVQAGSPSGSGGRTTDKAAGEGCFIATAAYGSNMDKHVKILSEFRDRHLLTNSIGRSILDVYDKFSPSVASYLHKHPFARAVVRYALVPITGIAYISLSIHPLALLFAFIFMLLTGVYFFKRSAIRSQRSAV